MVNYIKKNFIHRDTHEFGRGVTSYLKINNQYFKIVEIDDREDVEDVEHVEFIENQLAVALDKMFEKLKEVEINVNN